MRYSWEAGEGYYRDIPEIYPSRSTNVDFRGYLTRLYICEGGNVNPIVLTEKDAIVVCDIFSERHEVAKRCGIPTFECSMVELLVNSDCSVI